MMGGGWKLLTSRLDRPGADPYGVWGWESRGV